jgi:predicted dehydrogenase
MTHDASGAALRVGIVGCGLMGAKRAAALDSDTLVGVYDLDRARAQALAIEHHCECFDSLEALLGCDLDVAIVATTHDRLAENACRALDTGLHVLVEKPAGIGVMQIDEIASAAGRARRLVKVGFNHRFHPAIARAVAEARSGRFGPVMFARGLYGHGGRLGYEKEWRAQPDRSGGGELIDQGMHLLDISYWLLGPLPVRTALLRTSFWQMDVEDNAVLLLGENGDRSAPWSLLHASWTEWKNMFSLEVYCRTGKLHVTGLIGSYGPQRLQIHAMDAVMGPPRTEEVAYEPVDQSWSAEWAHFRHAIHAGGRADSLLGDLSSARYAWECVEQAYAEAHGALERS